MRPGTLVCILALCVTCGACSREEGEQAPGPDSQGASPESGALPAPAAYSGHDYRCSDGVELNARIDKGNIVLRMRGQTLTLSPTEGASGANYSGEGVSFLAQGGQAMLVREGEKAVTCTAS